MKQKILIIDDDDQIIDVIEKLLKEKNFDVLTASNGKEGLNLAEKELPDLILLDVHIPKINGLNVCKQLRKNRTTHLLPVIILSGKKTYEDKISGIKAGADDYITKPFDLQELLARIKSVLWHSHIARGSNPLTGLPGNPSIEYEINKKIKRRLKYALCYLDLNNFKAYNDKYGYKKGDGLLHKTATIINEAITQKGNSNDFIGHLGGDDFIIITNPEKADDVCSFIIKTFDENVSSFYAPDDLKQGFIENFDHQGNKLHFPFISIAIGIVTNERHKFNNHLEVSEIATEMKQYAKTFKTSIYKKDRSSYPRKKQL